MVIKQEVAYGIIEAITDLRKGDDLEDFTVIVDGISVRCHRFILGACSLFFRGMFRSGMREVEENCGHLNNVSHQTFTLILSALYTGCDILTEENVIEIWHATHMLRIEFLVRECEALLEQIISLENYEEIYENAKLFDSKRILKAEHNFMAQNFDTIRTSKTFLNLSFSELNALIKTDELVTKSEDKVVESIFQWTSYTPSTAEEEADNNSECGIEGQAVIQNDDNQEREAVERQQYLLSLISNSRHCLLSPEYLEELLSNPTIVDSPEIRGILFKAFCYQLQARHRHGQWPSGAVHRSKSDVKNVLIWTSLGSYYGRVRSANRILARSFFSERLTLELTFNSTTGRLTAFDNNLYELVQDGLNVFRDDSWTRIFSCKLSDQTFMISLGNFIYFLDGSLQTTL